MAEVMGGAASWSLCVAWKESMPEQVGKGHRLGTGPTSGPIVQPQPPARGCPQQHPAALRFTWHGLQKRRLFSG